MLPWSGGKHFSTMSCAEGRADQDTRAASQRHMFAVQKRSSQSKYDASPFLLSLRDALLIHIARAMRNAAPALHDAGPASVVRSA